MAARIRRKYHHNCMVHSPIFIVHTAQIFLRIRRMNECTIEISIIFITILLHKHTSTVDSRTPVTGTHTKRIFSYTTRTSKIFLKFWFRIRCGIIFTLIKYTLWITYENVKIRNSHSNRLKAPPDTNLWTILFIIVYLWIWSMRMDFQLLSIIKIDTVCTGFAWTCSDLV